jgi:hypothetical protein
MKRIVGLVISHVAAAIVGIILFCRWILRLAAKGDVAAFKDAIINFLDILLFGYVRHPYASYRSRRTIGPDKFTYASYCRARDREKEEEDLDE